MDSILGRTILGYRVVEKIGSGGFGNVYRVERNNIVGNTTRALKVITLPGENETLWAETGRRRILISKRNWIVFLTRLGFFR